MERPYEDDEDELRRRRRRMRRRQEIRRRRRRQMLIRRMIKVGIAAAVIGIVLLMIKMILIHYTRIYMRMEYMILKPKEATRSVITLLTVTETHPNRIYLR